MKKRHSLENAGQLPISGKDRSSVRGTERDAEILRGADSGGRRGRRPSLELAQEPVGPREAEQDDEPGMNVRKFESMPNPDVGQGGQNAAAKEGSMITMRRQRGGTGGPGGDG